MKKYNFLCWESIFYDMTNFPNQKKIRIEILKILKDNEIHTKEEVHSKLMKHFKLSKTQLAKKDPGSQRNSWDQRIRWELSWLRKNGLLKNVRLANFYITKQGLAALELLK